jgi:hypothetical protein
MFSPGLRVRQQKKRSHEDSVLDRHGFAILGETSDASACVISSGVWKGQLREPGALLTDPLFADATMAPHAGMPACAE